MKEAFRSAVGGQWRADCVENAGITTRKVVSLLILEMSRGNVPNQVLVEVGSLLRLRRSAN